MIRVCIRSINNNKLRMRESDPNKLISSTQKQDGETKRKGNKRHACEKVITFPLLPSTSSTLSPHLAPLSFPFWSPAGQYRALRCVCWLDGILVLRLIWVNTCCDSRPFQLVPLSPRNHSKLRQAGEAIRAGISIAQRWRSKEAQWWD